jgi:error-prone DNA polymerase
MTTGGEVVEDYGHVGLTLRSHPVSFLREDLRRQRIVTCAEAMRASDGRWLETAGLVLVRLMPGSAKGVMFITIEDEAGIANLVIWPKLYERQRWVILSAKMMAVRGRIQREGEVVHLVAHRLTDLSNTLASAAATPTSRCRTGTAISFAAVAQEPIRVGRVALDHGDQPIAIADYDRRKRKAHWLPCGSLSKYCDRA